MIQFLAFVACQSVLTYTGGNIIVSSLWGLEHVSHVGTLVEKTVARARETWRDSGISVKVFWINLSYRLISRRKRFIKEFRRREDFFCQRGEVTHGCVVGSY